MDKILVVGGTRGLGLTLTERLEEDHYNVLAVGVETMDVTKPEMVQETCNTFCPDTVIYLAVENLNVFVHKLKPDKVKSAVELNILVLNNDLSSSS